MIKISKNNVGDNPNFRWPRGMVPVAHLEGTGAPSFPENEQGNKLKKDPNLPPLNGLKTKTDPVRFILFLFIFY